MKRLISTGTVIIGVIITALFYIHFIHLPLKVKAVAAKYGAKYKKQITVSSVRYIPFRGARLKNLVLLSRTKEELLKAETVYFNASLWRWLLLRQLSFRVDLYPSAPKRPFGFNGVYHIRQKKLDLDFRIVNRFFAESQVIAGGLSVLFNNKNKESPAINLNLVSPDLNVQGHFYLTDNDIKIKDFSGRAFNSGFDLIGDVQNLDNHSMNIYGNLTLDLADIKRINPRYIKKLAEVKTSGRCAGKIYFAGKINNPEAGLKLDAPSIMADNISINDFSLNCKIQDRKASLTKCYAKLYGGELNLNGWCRLDNRESPANLNLNAFNLRIEDIISHFTDKHIPVHGRLFGTAQLEAPLTSPRDCMGKVWVSVSGSNVLELPFLRGIGEVLRLPEITRIEFKEASGNFAVANRRLKTDDLKIISSSVTIYFKGSMDFAGNLSFDIQPSFSPNFVSGSPNIGNILGVFSDSSGNFLGEIKMKGNIKEPHYTFKPISVEKIIPRGIEEGLKQLFKLKKK